MRRPAFKNLLALGAASCVTLALPSCATNDSMMFIIGVAERKAGSCTVKAQLDSPILARGTMDRVFASDYVAALLVGNQVTARGSRDRIRTETSRIELKGAEVHLETSQGKSLAPAFSSVGSGFVDASAGTDPAFSVMFTTLVPASIASQLPLGTVVAKVRVFGTSLGGRDIESAELGFPIEICEGCLVSYPAEDRDLTSDTDEYKCKVATDMPSSGGDVDLPCQLGIDIPAPCMLCSGISDVCSSPNKNCYYNSAACK
jgi:hypothetical protein